MERVMLRRLIAALLFIAAAFVAQAPATAQSGGFCSKFDSGLDGWGPCTDAPNVTVTTATDSGGISATDTYLKLTDLSGASRACSADPKYLGNWLTKMNGCGQICFDFKIFSSGYPPSPITPSITIVSGTSRATFYANFQVAVGDTSWHKQICAPIQDGASPPPSPNGHWTLSGSATWNQIITNVTMVQLPIDFTSQPSEVAGYDNICMSPGDCGEKPPVIKGCLEDSKVAIKCNGDGTYTVTLSGGSFTANTITLTSQTAGVTVSPPQQPWAPTTTWTVSGATPGQTITLAANASKTGGGKEPGTDQCCSGEITIVVPDCPKQPPIDVSIAKTGGTTPVQEPYYSFTLAISNNGAAFPGAGILTVTDVLPPLMTFTNVSVTPPGDWSCPTSVAAGGTLTCTYTGSGPTGTGVIGTITINATAGGGAPYPPITNCATVGVTSGYTDTDPSNNTSCVTITKPGQVGELIVKKEVVFAGPILLPSLIYPVAVTCGSNGTTLNLVDQVPQSIGNIPYGTSCALSETPPAPPNVCPPNQTPTWTTAFTPSNTVPINTPTTTEVVQNKLTCEPKGEQTGTLIVNKTIDNTTEADLSGLTYPASVTCGTATTPIALSASTAQTVPNVSGGSVCTVSEPFPPPPATGCPVERYPAWQPPVYSPANVTVPSGATATITVANTLACERGGYMLVTKTVINNTQADISGITFPVKLSCNQGTGNAFERIVNLSAGGQDILHNMGVGVPCTPSETLPAAPTNGCPAGSTPAWAAPSFSPPSLTSVAGAGPTLTVTNTLNCVPSVQTISKPPRPPQCKPPLVPGPVAGECVCRAGTVKRGSRCVEAITCRAPAKANRAGTACVCPEDMTKRGNTCVAHERGPRVTPADVIRIIPNFGGGGHGGQDGGGRSQGGQKGSSSPGVR
jgi:hypothetical protein